MQGARGTRARPQGWAGSSPLRIDIEVRGPGPAGEDALRLCILLLGL